MVEGGEQQGSGRTCEKEVTTKEKIKTLLKEYGKVAFLSHSTIFTISLAVTYSVLKAMDINTIIAMLPERYRCHQLNPAAQP